MTKEETTTIRVTVKVWQDICSLKTSPKQEINDIVEEAIYNLRKEKLGVIV
jgi:hypothetical protein